jgi:predicted RNA-binding protein
MDYWLYITNSDNWQITKETNILGASERYRNALSYMKIGDKCLIYVMSERNKSEITQSKITGEYEVISNMFEESERIFHAPKSMPSEIFKLRIRLKPTNLFENPIEFKPLIQKLTFIKNKRRWSLSLRGRAIVPIQESDYMFILSKK